MSSLSNHFSSLLKLHAKQPINLKKLHCLILKSFPFQDTFLLNNLISLYSESDLLAYAQRVFDQILQPSQFSYNALLSAHCKYGNITSMSKVFDSMPIKDGISWNCVISGHATHNSPHNAVQMYRLMLREGKTVPNRITFSTLLILSSQLSSLELGLQLHCQIVKYGFESYVFVGSPLLNMYMKASLVHDAKKVFSWMKEKNVVIYNTMLTGLLRCGMIEDSKKLFHDMSERDSISWTTMVTGFAQNGLELESLHLLRDMRLSETSIDQFTFGSALTACGKLSALREGKQLHAYILKTFYENNIFVGSALVDMYSKCKSMRYAEFTFMRMPSKNIISWTAIIVGYGQNGCSEEAVRIFTQMQRHGINPDEYTLGSIISSCANLAVLEEGTQFHSKAISLGLISYITVSNALVTLYGKCGNVEESHKLFNEMKIKDQVSWTALIVGYAQFGKAKETIELFESMSEKNIQPDGVTYIGVLSACSRAGLVEKGEMYFTSMVKEHNITPLQDHYTCMIDLFGRAGKLEEAKMFIQKRMPCAPDAIGWATLLSSCRTYKNMEIGKWAAEALLEVDPLNAASYVLLSNMYAKQGKWEEVAKMRRGMRDKGARKEPGCSWIKYKNKVHIFSANDESHPESEKIFMKLKRIEREIEEEGYMPDMDMILHDVEEDEKRRMLSQHSERLAIAFGLLVVADNLAIRVHKNLRVCGDCHNWTKFVSKVSGREILVRDAVRFHKFEDGFCSCGDFW